MSAGFFIHSFAAQPMTSQSHTALNTLAGAAPAQAGDPLGSIDTPTLVLDLDAFETNLARMQAWANQHGVGLRAHAKAHKCPQIALRQIEHGAIGICCQKVSEAVPFVQAGVKDILISNQIVGAPKLALLAELTRHARVAVCVDNADNLHAIAQAMQAAGTRIDILVEIDVGQGRCGVNTPETALALAQQAGTTPGTRFRGLQAYHGAVQHVREPAARADICREVAARIRSYVDVLQTAGLAVGTISGAGTGSAQFDAASGIYTELQAGSYAFMDADYAANHWQSDLQFEPSLSLLTTVMSVATPGRAVLDAGLKAMTTESGLPRVMHRPGVTVRQVNDEHTVLVIDGGASGEAAVLPALGEKVHLMLPHVDPAFNLHDVVVTVRDGQVTGTWPIEARGPGR